VIVVVSRRSAPSKAGIDPKRLFEVIPTNRRYAAECGRRRNDKSEIELNNPSDMPGVVKNADIKEPIRINGELVDALSMLVYRDWAEALGPRDGRETQGPHPAAHVPDHPVQAAIAGNVHRARDDPGAPQGRQRQVLRRRCYAQAQAAREAEGRQEEVQQFGKVHIP
jgi:translation elongation factor EF-4